MRFRTLIMGAVIAVVACVNDTSSSGDILSDPHYTALVGSLHLQDYQVKRLAMFVRTIQDARKIYSAADDDVKNVARTNLDREIERTLPVLIPVADVEEVRAFLHAALYSQ